ncbi:MAG: site-specific DNA-methyltransferase [Deltaproteobacteria bacterium]|nr:site-specific DNA-methyltransferase [Deltaproteobacteria bacterium]
MAVQIHLGDNLDVMRRFSTGSFHLAYLDPPFNTGRRQAATRIRGTPDPDGTRVGFRGRRYRTERVSGPSFEDTFDDYPAFLGPRLEEAWRLLDPSGSLFLQLDWREVHHVKVLADALFGRRRFLNEIIWAWDYGGRSRRRWPAKHGNILWYAKNPRKYTFRAEEVDRIPYMAPELVGAEKAARGKSPTDTWWHTIVGPTSRERTGWPTQKPLGILERIVRVHSAPGDRLLDPFAGSGTLGEAALRLGRDAVLVDCDPRAVQVMERRLGVSACP